ncbi:MAG: hypothetical protein JJU48_05460 [Methylophaga sp.]|nr:hypothetical protein [Methylophaga sp.]
MKELLEKAFAEKGLTVPTANESAVKQVPSRFSKKRKHNQTPQPRSPQTKRIPRSPAGSKAKMQVPEKQNAEKAIDISCYSNTQKPKPPSQGKSLKISISKAAKVSIPDNLSDRRLPLSKCVEYGQVTQCCEGAEVQDEREVVIGLDFGTSSVKAVVGDRGLGKAFAVPFYEASDIDAYLLPSRLYLSDGKFALFGKDQPAYRDLKLSLIAHPTEKCYQIPVIGYISLVLQHIRGWLYKEHAEIYSTCQIVWTLSIGLPAEYHLENELLFAFQQVANISWEVSLSEGEVTEELINKVYTEYQRTGQQGIKTAPVDDCEIRIVPEIAAQIYGFVNSSKFNDRDKNFYLMVDVGAGSVDSSLFHVNRGRGGKWSFEFYTSVVAPNGVMNLHRERVNWWLKQLSGLNNTQNLVQELRQLKYPTDWVSPLPLSFEQYLSGVELEYGDEHNPDLLFFNVRLLKQVRGETYSVAKKKNLIGEHDLKHIPAFYCGGGMQIPLYRDLREKLKRHPNCSWMKAEPRTIELPEDMEAPGVERKNYHRLSVAYGLSFLNVKEVTQIKPFVEPIESTEFSWRDNYIDKDMC